MSQLEIISNQGPASLAKSLPVLWRDAKSVDIASAFVSAGGLDALSTALNAARKAPVRLLVGLYQCFITPAVLDRLLSLQKRSGGRISVHVSRNPRFHAKMAVSCHRRTTKVVIGSSNLTKGGLTEPGELNAVISLPAKSAHARQAGQAFETEWFFSFPLTSRFAGDYRRYFKYLGDRGNPAPAPVALLKRAPLQEDAPSTVNRQFWRTGITGTLKEATVATIQEETDWDKKGYLFFSSYKPLYGIGDHLLLFDFVSDWVSENRIVAATHTISRTPDGRDFVAYMPVPRISKRRLTEGSQRVLEAILRLRRKGDLQKSRKLSKKDAAALIDFLRTRRMSKAG